MENTEFYIEYINVKDCNENYLEKEYKRIKNICNNANPSFVFIDYHSIKTRFNYPQWGIPQGDEKIWCIASASIIAKYHLNQLWDKFIKQYPEYKNTGKGCIIKRCVEPIIKNGYLPKWHRRKWLEAFFETTNIFESLNINQS